MKCDFHYLFTHFRYLSRGTIFEYWKVLDIRYGHLWKVLLKSTNIALCLMMKTFETSIIDIWCWDEILNRLILSERGKGQCCNPKISRIYQLITCRVTNLLQCLYFITSMFCAVRWICLNFSAWTYGIDSFRSTWKLHLLVFTVKHLSAQGFLFFPGRVLLHCDSYMTTCLRALSYDAIQLIWSF